MQDNQPTSFEIEVLQGLAGLRADMKSILGNGQKGRLGKLEDDVELLKTNASESKGSKKVIFGFLGLSGLGEVIFHWLTRKP